MYIAVCPYTVITIFAMHNMAIRKFWFVAMLLALVAAVFPQPYPRFEFNGTVLTNNSYIICRGLIGIGPNNSLHCVTDNSLCCNNYGEGAWSLESEPNEDPPEFTLTRRSEGGPATTVEWRREGELVQEDSNHMSSQIIVDPSINAVYNNTLRVRGREEGRYICGVNNDFHATDSPSDIITATLILYCKLY